MPKGGPEKRLSYREQQQQQIQQLMQQHVEQQQQSSGAVAATPDRIAKLEEDAKKFAQGVKIEFMAKDAY